MIVASVADGVGFFASPAGMVTLPFYLCGRSAEPKRPTMYGEIIPACRRNRRTLGTVTLTGFLIWGMTALIEAL